MSVVRTEDSNNGKALGRTSVFPADARKSDYGEVLDFAQPGLSKRELFAAMMMQGVMQGLGVRSDEFGPTEPVNPEEIAIDAVKAADALLKELARG